MDPEFWHDRWREGRIGFHEGRTNAFLARHADLLGEGRRVLVPLCGKTHDLAFLAERGHRVLGVELSALAVEAFFAEHELPVTRRSLPPFEVWESGPIAILLGDFFALTPAHFEGHAVDALYDRAALIALPEPLRSPYAAHVRALMPRGTSGLVITFEYPQELMAGPPFSVSEPALRALYPGLALEQIDSAMADAQRLREVGMVAIERCFAVRF